MTGAPLFTLATRPPHQFIGAVNVPACKTQTRREQRERHCLACGLFKITILPGGERAYRYGALGEQFAADCDPLCVPVGTQAEQGPKIEAVP